MLKFECYSKENVLKPQNVEKNYFMIMQIKITFLLLASLYLSSYTNDDTDISELKLKDKIIRKGEYKNEIPDYYNIDPIVIDKPQ